MPHGSRLRLTVTVDLGDLDTFRVTILDSTYLTVLTTVLHAVEATSHCVLPTKLRQSVRAAIGGEGIATFEVLRQSHDIGVPDFVIPPFTMGDASSVEAAGEALRSSTRDAPERELLLGVGDTAATPWRPIMTDPRSWGT